MNLPQRKLLVAGLLAAFVCQGFLVYTDPVAAERPPLSAEAQRGRSIWLAKNCFACHQIYGFGGFIGPDLTNAAQRVPRARLDELLTKGSKQMPAFGLGKAEIDAIEQYLRAIDRTGQGQARQRVPPPVAAVNAAIDARIGAAEPGVQQGRQLFAAFCASCHVPLRANPLGLGMAPDPTGIANRLSVAEIERTVTEGRAERGMPPAALAKEQREVVIAYLQWLAKVRPELLQATGGENELGALPWWEFR